MTTNGTTSRDYPSRVVSRNLKHATSYLTMKKTCKNPLTDTGHCGMVGDNERDCCQDGMHKSPRRGRKLSWHPFHCLKPGGGFLFSGYGHWTGPDICRLRVTTRDRDCVGLVGEGQWMRLRYGLWSEKTRRILRESRKRVGPAPSVIRAVYLLANIEDEAGKSYLSTGYTGHDITGPGTTGVGVSLARMPRHKTGGPNEDKAFRRDH